MSFVLVYVAVAAAITAVLAALGLPALIQFIVFIPLTLVLLRVVRPQTVALLGIKRPLLRLNATSGLVDRIAVVEQGVSDSGGMVRLGNGEFWSARAYPPGTSMPVGASVRVMFVEGLTVYVSTTSEPGHADLPPETREHPGEDSR
jgi:membrane protein implicated in regulation of membrane protease activity